MNGMTSEWSPQLKTRDHADPAGLSLPLAHWSLTGTFLERAKMSLFPNSNWLIALEILTTMVAMEDYHLTLLNTLDTLVELKVMLLILTLLRTESVCSENQFLWDTSDMVASTSLKGMRSKWQTDSTMLAQLLFLSK